MAEHDGEVAIVNTPETPPNEAADQGMPLGLIWAESILLFLVLLVYPTVCWIKSCIVLTRGADAGEARKSILREMRGLHLPRGSVRSMLALAVIGTFIIYLVFGTNDPKVISVFGTLSASIIGFYFGSRSSSTPPTPP